MATCPHCGHNFIGNDSAASLALAAIGEGHSNMDWIKSQMPGLADKEIYNALSYLVRKGLAVRVRYGVYRRGDAPVKTAERK